MDEKRLSIPACLALRLAFLVFALMAWSCSMPKIVVLKDPLSAQEHVDLGLAYEQKGMLDLAEKEYKKAAWKQKDWAVPYFDLGNIAYKQKDLKSAEGYYCDALKRDGNNPDIMNNLANILHETGRDEEAKALINRALSIQHRAEYLDTEKKIMGQ